MNIERIYDVGQIVWFNTENTPYKIDGRILVKIRNVHRTPVTGRTLYDVIPVVKKTYDLYGAYGDELELADTQIEL